MKSTPNTQIGNNEICATCPLKQQDRAVREALEVAGFTGYRYNVPEAVRIVVSENQSTEQ